MLTLFIKTSASDSVPGLRDRIKYAGNPIPEGNNAAVIISNKVIMKHFVFPEVQKMFRESVHAEELPSKPGAYQIQGTGDYQTHVGGIKIPASDLFISKEGVA